MKTALAWALLGLILAELVQLYTDLETAGLIAQVLVLSLPVLAWRHLQMREIYLLGICAVLALLSLQFEKDVLTLFAEGLSRSAYLASFILLMALLREGALTSNSVVDIGAYLTRQPPNKRFVAVFGGSHFLSVMINLGSLSLLAPIIQRGVRAGKAPGEPLNEVDRIHERRQLTASVRGFSWFLVWAPTAVTQAIMPTLMNGIDTLRLMGTGLLLACLMLIVSWAEDALRWGRTQKARPEVVKPPRFPGRSFRNFGLVCLALFSSSVLFSQAGNVSIVTGVMLAAPVVVVIWVTMQKLEGTTGPARLHEIAFTAVPGFCREAVFIACAGFIGTLAARLVPADLLAEAINLQDMPGWLVLLSLTISVWGFGQVGLSPITMAIFLASLVSEFDAFPVDMTFAALAIAAGTAVCTTGAPFSSGAIMLARATGHSTTTLTWRWNGLYTLLCIMVLGIVYASIA